MATVFISYSHTDEALRDELEVHLSMLKREGAIETWHDRRILAGDELDGTIDAKLEIAEVILLLVSPDFLASNYCYDVEVQLAMARHEANTARVIPVILRPCDWQSSVAPFKKLLAAPRDSVPITKWPNRDEAFLDVVTQIRAALPIAKPLKREPMRESRSGVDPVAEIPRSSNLRLKKTFTEVDRDHFIEEAFEYMARFFEKSLDELAARNAGIEVRFRRIDGNAFGCVVYQNGQAVARCGVRQGGSSRSFGGGITYSQNDSAPANSYNENLSAEANDQSLFLRPMGMGMLGRAASDNHMSFESAAEYYWSLLVDPLQR
ncbi:MAG: toll/interleukin-1 receptor domain-containing protein [Gammaproteobacteria bacterium]|nr:toll/interleukin-1 receptor domain-containing protein [Gammaproteobacteria bacterium]